MSTLVEKYSQYPRRFRYILYELDSNQFNFRKESIKQRQNIEDDIMSLCRWMSDIYVGTSTWCQIVQKLIHQFKLSILWFFKKGFLKILSTKLYTTSFKKNGKGIIYLVNTIIKQVNSKAVFLDFKLNVIKDLKRISKLRLGRVSQQWKKNHHCIKLSEDQLFFYKFICNSRKWARQCKQNFKQRSQNIFRENLPKIISELQMLKNEEQYIITYILEYLSYFQEQFYYAKTKSYKKMKNKVDKYLIKHPDSIKSSCQPTFSSQDQKYFLIQSQKFQILSSATTTQDEKDDKKQISSNSILQTVEQLHKQGISLEQGQLSMNSIAYVNSIQLEAIVNESQEQKKAVDNKQSDYPDNEILIQSRKELKRNIILEKSQYQRQPKKKIKTIQVNDSEKLKERYEGQKKHNGKSMYWRKVINIKKQIQY